MTQIDSYIAQKEELCRKNDAILPELYGEYGVKRGLRDQSGNGVLAGLTNISKITSFENVNGEKTPCEGKLWYRGYRVEELLNSLGEKELGYGAVVNLQARAFEYKNKFGEGISASLDGVFILEPAKNNVMANIAE